jgi:hypothetical protein
MNSLLECVNKICQSVRKQNTNGVSFKKLIGSTRKNFKEGGLDILLKTKKEKDLDNSHFYVMAYYDSDDDFNQEIPIEVFIHHNFDDRARFQEHQITEFLIQIFDAVVHELCHQQQSRKRNYEIFGHPGTENYKKYLADPDELDAYALSISIELLRVMPKSRIQTYMTRIGILAKMKQGNSLVSPNLHSYFGHFKNTNLIKRLSKKIYKNIESIDKTHIFL